MRDEVAAAARRLAAAGLARGASGNVSARKGDRVFITASGAQLARATRDDVVRVRAGGGSTGGGSATDGGGDDATDRKPSSELALHEAVYARHGCGAIVHAHPPYATALACVLEDELPAVHYECVLLGGPPRIVPYARFGTQELADATTAALEGRSAVLLANHGTVTTGADLNGALEAAELLEWLAAVYWRAAAAGTPRALSDDDLQAARKAMNLK